MQRSNCHVRIVETIAMEHCILLASSSCKLLSNYLSLFFTLLSVLLSHKGTPTGSWKRDSENGLLIILGQSTDRIMWRKSVEIVWTFRLSLSSYRMSKFLFYLKNKRKWDKTRKYLVDLYCLQTWITNIYHLLVYSYRLLIYCSFACFIITHIPM